MGMVDEKGGWVVMDLNLRETLPFTFERKAAATLVILYDGEARSPEELAQEINELELVSMATEEFNKWAEMRVRRHYEAHHGPGIWVTDPALRGPGA